MVWSCIKNLLCFSFYIYILFSISECYKVLNLPDLPSNISCHVADVCSKIDCCLHVPLINRTFNFDVDIDPCYQEFVVGIEKMSHKYKLLSYKFGTLEHFNVLGLLRLK